MSTLLPAFYFVLLFGAMLVGLLLMVIGIVLLLKLKNKLPGGITAALGAAFTILPMAIFLYLTVTPRLLG